MSSAARLAANAANAQHSTGRRTSEGKECSCQNATRHGLTSTRLIVQDDESEEFEELQSSLLEEVRLEGALQTNRMIRITYERQGKLRGEAPGLVTWGEVSKRTHRNLGQDLIRYIEWETETLAARSLARKQANAKTNPQPERGLHQSAA